MPPKKKYTRRNVLKIKKSKVVKFVDDLLPPRKKKLVRKPTPFPVTRGRVPKLRPRNRPPPLKEDGDLQGSGVMEEALKELSSIQKPIDEEDFKTIFRGIVLGLSLAAEKKSEEKPTTPANPKPGDAKISDKSAPSGTELQSVKAKQSVDSLSSKSSFVSSRHSSGGYMRFEGWKQG